MLAPLDPHLMRYPEGPPMGYGYRGNIGVPGASTFHEGIDIAVPVGTPVYAVADGTVVLTTDSGAPGISTLYQIDPTTRLRCNHFSRRYFSRGQSFREGTVIGLSGNTGASGGPHLHFSVFKLRGGRYQSIDPTPWLRSVLAGTAGGSETPFEPDAPVEEEEEDMALKGAYYTRTDGKTVYMLFNEASGFCVEHSGVPGSYNNEIAAAWETNSWAKITEAHATVLKASLGAVRPREIPAQLAVDLTGTVDFE